MMQVMNFVTLDQAISTAIQLPLDQQEMLIDILNKRRIEIRRQEIIADANNSIQAFRDGQFKMLSAEAAIAELHCTFEDDE